MTGAEIIIFPGVRVERAPDTVKANPPAAEGKPKVIHSWNILLMPDGSLAAQMTFTSKAHLEAAAGNEKTDLLTFIDEAQTAMGLAETEALLFDGGGDGGGERA